MILLIIYNTIVIICEFTINNVIALILKYGLNYINKITSSAKFQFIS